MNQVLKEVTKFLLLIDWASGGSLLYMVSLSWPQLTDNCIW